MGDWRKLGGRLRLKADGRLEIAVPRHFTAEQPALTFTQDVFDTNIEDHRLGRKLPKWTNNSSSIHHLGSDLRSFAGPSGGSKTIQDMIKRQTPLLSLHVTSFHNAAVVVLSWPHVLMDAMGTCALLRNWSLVMNGKEEEVSAVASAREDVLEHAELEGKGREEELLVHDKPLSTGRLMMFALKMLWQNLVGPGFQERTMVLQERHFDELRTRAQEDLASEAEQKQPPISDGDVLAAWAARSMALSQPGLRSIAFFSIINARFRLPMLRQRPGEDYIQNFLLTSCFNLSPRVARGPLGPIALSHRENVAAQSTERQVWAFVRTQREHIRKKGDFKNYLRDAHATPLLFNNLAKMGILQAIDFAAAVVKRGDEDVSRRNPTGSALYFTPLSRSLDPFFKINHFHVLGKDHAGQYQVTALLRPGMWAVMEQELERIDGYFGDELLI
ncbi:hypothetical protein G6O67_003090 [Ophiocordyceps sinensis]|uniref:BCL5p n=1 Tax=Ophiocordyceps sinensis TaxID=72228 RepID=A0A8H4V7Y9_9HYPO|nr:hypothetical protein G6O67_003090 [Ophiocordyceps sinensis]